MYAGGILTTYKGGGGVEEVGVEEVGGEGGEECSSGRENYFPWGILSVFYRLLEVCTWHLLITRRDV